MLLKTTLITAASLMLSGCFEAHNQGATDVSLHAFKRISYVCKEPVFKDGVLISCGEDSDTAQTVTEVREHNAAYEAIQLDNQENN